MGITLTNMTITTLYRKNANSIGSWSIHAEGNVIHIRHCTTLGGSLVCHTETVDGGKQGRTIWAQVQSRIDSRISRMLDKGYKRTLDEARVSSTNQLGLTRPMLAHPIDKVANPDKRGAVLQKKLNGHRCLITRQNGEIIPYTRQGKPIPSIKHIVKALGDRLPEGVTIDGELYEHGVPLQTLSSWIKREQENTYRLNFVAYDLIAYDSYIDRHQELSEICQGARNEALGKVLVLPYEPYVDDARMNHRLHEVRAAKFEGLMMRLHGRGYQPGVRSSSLLKVKVFDDAEFKVLDIRPSADGWGICVCEIRPGLTFDTSAPGSIAEKHEALRNKEKYIGRMLTVEYAELTRDGVPFHCSATGWRDDI